LAEALSEVMTMRTDILGAHGDLPAELDSFIGRERELEEIRSLLRARQLVTLTGPGGVGKTRLSLRVAMIERDQFAEGIWIVELAALAAPELVAETIARVVATPPASELPPLDALTYFLGAKRAFFVFDNCEHLLAEVGRVATHLASSCPNVKVLMTSREPLNIAGEWIVRVPPLALPAAEESEELSRALRSDAVRLFVERAQAAEPSFRLSDANALAVTDICRRLDGMPLALELAARRVRGMGVAYLGARLDDRFQLLVEGDRSAVPRHQALRALVDWSYDLLSVPGRIVLRRLGVFVGSFTLEAAEVVCAGEASDGTILPESVLESLLQLVDKSLVQFDHDASRYRLLETIRLYARQRLAEAGELEFLGRQHFAWYLTMAEEGKALLGGPGQEEWFDRLEQERDNLRAALAWAIEAGRADEAARLALAFWRLWYSRAYLPEGLRWLEQILALGRKTAPPAALYPPLLNALGVLSHSSNRFEQAEAYHEEALRLWRENGDLTGVAQGLIDRAWCAFQQMRLDEALRYAEESLAVARVTSDQRLIALALQMAGTAGAETDLFADYISGLDESLAIFERLGDAANIAQTLDALVHAEIRRGSARAKPLLLASVRLHVQTRAYVNLIGSLVALLYAAMNASEQPQGARYAAQALGMMKTWEETIRGSDSPWAATRPAEFASALTDILGPEAFAQAFAEGRRMTGADLVPLAEKIAGSSQGDAIPPVPSTSADVGLTPREREVLRLVATGLTNAQVAERLIITPRTVNAHLTAIYSKLGVQSRAGAIRYALEHDLA
jgi:predicted ATPase/DNA-binding CsgD family transcriptional regulator